ncbi:MAG: hypothetical protein AAF799_05160 [Myxococcota bacterium]
MSSLRTFVLAALLGASGCGESPILALCDAHTELETVGSHEATRGIDAYKTARLDAGHGLNSEQEILHAVSELPDTGRARCVSLEAWYAAH